MPAFTTSRGEVPSTSSAALCAPQPPPLFASMTSFSMPRTVGFRPPFASIGASSSAAASAPGALLFGAPLKDPATGVAFDGQCCVLSKSSCPKLAGVG